MLHGMEMVLNPDLDAYVRVVEEDEAEQTV
jgi:hypothetical protein